MISDAVLIYREENWNHGHLLACEFRVDWRKAELHFFIHFLLTIEPLHLSTVSVPTVDGTACQLCETPILESMPLLSRRNARPLLQTVNGERHAKQDDHAEQLPTPPSTNSTRSSMTASNTMEEEDIYRPPDDSSEDERPISTLATNPASFRPPRQVEGSVKEPHKPTFKQPSSFTPESGGSKRASFSHPPSGESDSMIFEEERYKRRKTFALTNIHAPQKIEKGYGSKQRHSLQIYSAKNSRFKAARTLKTKSQEEVPAKPQFKVAKGADMFEFGKSEPLPGFQAPRCASEIKNEGAARSYSLSSSSSPLSSPRSQKGEDIKDLVLPEPLPYRFECALCGEQVDVFLKESFENQFTKGQPILNYKWQQRFCRWHKEHDAKRIRVERGYPEIDWNRLERRMRRHHKHLKDVMSDVRPSHYRDQWSEKIKERSKTAMQVLSSDGAKRGASVGYYGPRGERAM